MLRMASVGLASGGCGTTSCIPRISGTTNGVCIGSDSELCGGVVIESSLVALKLNDLGCVCTVAFSRARMVASTSRSRNRCSLAWN